MEKRSSALPVNRITRAWLAAAMLSVGLASTVAGQTGRAFGDSARFGLRILQLDPVNERARIATSNAKNLIVLAVVPGKEIEVIVPGDTPLKREREKDVFSIDMRRLSDEISPQDAGDDARARLAYDRCMRQARATAQRVAEQKARATRRDSTGKIIGGGGSTGDVDGSTLQNLEVSCDRLAQVSGKRRAPTFMAARARADRYLVVLNSSSPISRIQLYERLATLTAVAPDVATTIEAIAAGLYVGVKGTWGGYFVAW